MAGHSHDFVETYSGPLAFGLSREIDEASLVVYVQKFADDAVMEVIKTRLADQEIREIVDFLTGLLKRHLSETEYHRLFLRDAG
jgi:hypothetical protein